MVTLGSQISYALRSHSAELSEEQDRLSALMTEEVVFMPHAQALREANVRESVQESTPVKQRSARRSIGGSTSKQQHTPAVRQREITPEIEVPSLFIEPPTVRRPPPDLSTLKTPVRRTRASLAPRTEPQTETKVLTRSRLRKSSVTVKEEPADETEDDVADVIQVATPARRTRVIRKTRSRGNLLD
jgi:hypothetical protein